MSNSNNQQEQNKSFGTIIEYCVPEEFNLVTLMTEYKTKSGVIRFLSSQNKERSWIAKFMNIRYQHVRNVLTQPLKQTT